MCQLVLPLPHVAAKVQTPKRGPWDRAHQAWQSVLPLTQGWVHVGEEVCTLSLSQVRGQVAGGGLSAPSYSDSPASELA